MRFKLQFCNCLLSAECYGCLAEGHGKCVLIAASTVPAQYLQYICGSLWLLAYDEWPYAALVCCMVSNSPIHAITWITTHLETTKGWKAELACLVDP